MKVYIIDRWFPVFHYINMFVVNILAIEYAIIYLGLSSKTEISGYLHFKVYDITFSWQHTTIVIIIITAII